MGQCVRYLCVASCRHVQIKQAVDDILVCEIIKVHEYLHKYYPVAGVHAPWPWPGVLRGIL